MLRLIHTADIHLGAPLNLWDSSIVSQFREARELAFADVVERAVGLRADAFLIAGDLFDDSAPSRKTEQFFVNQMEILNGARIPVYYCTGNHDFEIMKNRHYQWPGNVHIFYKPEPESVLLEVGGIRLRIVSCGHHSAQDPVNRVSKFPHRFGPEPHIGLVHCMVTNASEIDNNCVYLPCHSEDLRALKYDYWALGHIHKRQQIPGINGFYPGNPQAFKLKETGSKGFLFIEVSEVGCHGTYTPVDRLIVSPMRIDISTCAEWEHLPALVSSAVTENLRQGESLVCTIALNGKSLFRNLLQSPSGKEELRNEIIRATGYESFVLDCREIQPWVNSQDFIEQTPWLQELERLMNLNQEDSERDALLHGLELAGFREGARDEYLNQLLTGLMDDMAEQYGEIGHEHSKT